MEWPRGLEAQGFFQPHLSPRTSIALRVSSNRRIPPVLNQRRNQISNLLEKKPKMLKGEIFSLTIFLPGLGFYQ
jgi:hypothetical protein